MLRPRRVWESSLNNWTLCLSELVKKGFAMDIEGAPTEIEAGSDESWVINFSNRSLLRVDPRYFISTLLCVSSMS